MDKQKKLIIGITAEGSVNLLLGQLTYFKSLGYKTYLLAPYSERSAKFCQDEGCEHLVINIQREISLWRDIKTLWQIIRIFHRIKPDIVNLGTPKVSLLGMIAAFILRVKTRIYTCRGFRFEHEKGKKRKVLIMMERLTSLLAHRVICISHSVQNLGLAFKIFEGEKSLVIGKGSSNGVNLSLFDASRLNKDAQLALKTELGLNEKFVFGFIGRIVDRKGINELIQVFDALYKVDNNVRLLLVGPFEMDQISDKQLKDKADQHPGIMNIGRVMQGNVPEYLALIDVFVLPAWWEGFGNVLIQAAAMGIPVISTKATGTQDAVQEGFNGILVPVKDFERLKESMILLRNDESTRKKMGENGKIWAKHFDREFIWKELDKIYQERNV
ncbi:MAG: glycosyltransferase family 1 protein [Bacteroidetes bacterium]|nr:MAG: glycosyltransferase family 1 protein [Bacteroidota bacterium]